MTVESAAGKVDANAGTDDGWPLVGKNTGEIWFDTDIEDDPDADAADEGSRVGGDNVVVDG